MKQASPQELQTYMQQEKYEILWDGVLEIERKYSHNIKELHTRCGECRGYVDKNGANCIFELPLATHSVTSFSFVAPYIDNFESVKVNKLTAYVTGGGFKSVGNNFTNVEPEVSIIFPGSTGSQENIMGNFSFEIDDTYSQFGYNPTTGIAQFTQKIRWSYSPGTLGGGVGLLSYEDEVTTRSGHLDFKWSSPKIGPSFDCYCDINNK